MHAVLDWSDFRIFLAIVRERSLSAAARRLKIDQSTVGRRLLVLETSTGTRLFDRTPEGYALTAAGEAVLASVEEIESQAIAVERRLVGRDARIEGTVRLATSDSFATWFLVPHLARLRLRHPGIGIELVTGNRPVSLARREADLSLRLTRPEEPNLVARRIGQGAWAVYASKAYLARRGVPAPGATFEGHDILAFDDELAGTIGARWLKENTPQGRVVLTSNSLVSQGVALLAGLGITALPCLFGDTQPSLQRLSPGIIGHHDVWLVVHHDVRATARVRAVMNFLTALIKKEGPLISGTKSRRPGAPRPRSKRR
jgi:DNA-binding transcriptional LysR family regulator